MNCGLIDPLSYYQRFQSVHGHTTATAPGQGQSPALSQTKPQPPMFDTTAHSLPMTYLHLIPYHSLPSSQSSFTPLTKVANSQLLAVAALRQARSSQGCRCY